MTERRRDPITGEWRTFATSRQHRTFLPPVSGCPLCPTRTPEAPTEIPWPSFEVAVFDNRFPAFELDPPPPSIDGNALHQVAPAVGRCEVVVYSDDHSASLATLGRARIRLLIDVWAERYATLGREDDIAYVLVFENRGEAVGVTLQHPHGQIYGYPEIPPVVARHLAIAQRHLDERGTCVVCDVVAQETADGTRLLSHNDAFTAFVPFAARFPYEVNLVSRRHAASLLDLSDPERGELAEMLEHVLVTYDQLFGFPLPYVMAVHQAPPDDGEWQPVSHLRFEFMPVHRSHDRLKYLAGSELAAGAFLNDVAPEAAAQALREAAVRLLR